VAPALDVFEVFASFQGEGIHLGRAQVFLRLAGCNLDCRYCDTRPARLVPAAARVESEPFSRAFSELANPVQPDRLAGLLRGMFRPGVHSLSLTGGEPLEQVEGLEALLEALAPAPVPLYLETNGTLPGAFERVAGAVDVVAMDVKLASVTGLESRLGDHCAFLAAARPGQAFLKVVVCEGVDLDELEEAALELGALGRARALVLQPATAEGEGVETPSLDTLREAFTVASRYFEDVRVIPQAHRAANLP
jgi:7-carboxy-7-deazaguanine synthase